MARELVRLRGKSAVVTGAAKGIGRATAELFAREGARLVVNDVDGEGLEGLRERLAASGAEVGTVVGDVSVVEDARRIIDAAVGGFGRIDVLVANAGVIPLNNVVNATPENWDAVMAVDGRGRRSRPRTVLRSSWRPGSPSTSPSSGHTEGSG